jgi:hypothetical protein
MICLENITSVSFSLLIVLKKPRTFVVGLNFGSERQSSHICGCWQMTRVVRAFEVGGERAVV